MLTIVSLLSVESVLLSPQNKVSRNAPSYMFKAKIKATRQVTRDTHHI